MSALFFQIFPVSLSWLLCLFSFRPLSFSWDLYYLYQRSINLPHFFSHACFLSLLFSLILYFTVFLPPPPYSFLCLSSSPLGFSPVERLSSKGNDRVTVFDSAECFDMEALNKLITCVWKILRVSSKRGMKALLRDEGENWWKICMKVCWGKMHECRKMCLYLKTWCFMFFFLIWI